MVGAAHEHIGLDADLAEFRDRLLRRLRLQFARRDQIGHERDVDENHVLRPDFERELPHGLEKRQSLDISGRAADLRDQHVRVFATSVNALLDFVGHVRDHLHGLAEIVPAPLPLNHAFVDLAGRKRVEPREFSARETLVVPEVEIGLGSVLQDVNFPVLIRAHRARIDVEIRVELLNADDKSAHLQQCTQGRGRKTLAQRRNDATRDENVFHGCQG